MTAQFEAYILNPFQQSVCFLLKDTYGVVSGFLYGYAF